MSQKKKVLLQIDCDPVPSSFDSIVAIDSGIDQLLTFPSVEPLAIQSIVHGAMFTRGGADLSSTAIFLGGSSVDDVTRNLHSVQATFFGPVRVSVMVDPNGCNTTAAAAVLSASRHSSLSGATVVVLGGTGPVGHRIGWLSAREGARVTIVSRKLGRAEEVRDSILASGPEWNVEAFEAISEQQIQELAGRAEFLFSAGAAGVRFLGDGWLEQARHLKVAVDCNAVPPSGMAGVEVTDNGRESGSVRVYGAIGIGGLKMKIHKEAIRSLFADNKQVLNTLELYAIGQKILSGS